VWSEVTKPSEYSPLRGYSMITSRENCSPEVLKIEVVNCLAEP